MNVFQKMAADAAAKAAAEAAEARKKAEAFEAAEAEGAIDAKRADRAEAIGRTRAIEDEWEGEVRRKDRAEARAKEKAAGVAEKNKRSPKPRRLRVPRPRKLRVTKGPKLGNAHLSHDADGRRLAVIEDGNAELRKLSRKDFTVDEDEPRELNFLTFGDMVRSYSAMMFLHCLGLEWNCWYTCTWASVELTTDGQVEEAITNHVESLRKWMTKRKKGDKEKRRFFYIWSVERGEKHGLHFHMLCHIPADVDLDLFEHQVDQNIFTLTGMRPRVPAGGRRKTAKRGRGRPVAGGVEVPVDDTCTVHIVKNSNVDQQWKRWRYIMKGLDPDEGMRLPGSAIRQRTTIHEYLGLERESHEGRYGGLRLGVSQALGPQARTTFACKHGMPDNPLWTRKKPSDLYGRQFLKWAEALAEWKREPEPTGKLLKSLDGWM